MTRLSSLIVEIAGRAWRTSERSFDLSIPLTFDGPQPRFFGAAHATARPIESSGFVGAVSRGGSCNCATYVLTPHCNGTHTECVGHITLAPMSVHEVQVPELLPALLVSVEPQESQTTPENSDPTPRAGDRLITRERLQSAAHRHEMSSHARALVVRTLPNPDTKRVRDYDLDAAPYFTAEAMQWIVQRGIEHLIVDVPSLDRADDDGKLTAHRIFWQVSPGHRSVDAHARSQATITELAYIDAQVPDGFYLLNLQIAPFVADAAPSRPILVPLVPA